MPGNRTRTSRMARSRSPPSKPGAMRSTNSGVASMPSATITLVASASRPNTAPATLSDSSASFLPSSWAYTGMKEPDSTPSPKRFCRKLGMRSAALKTAAASALPR
ncbi:hypothetical protein COSO111634_09790 [Corallococcus soli]